MDLALKMSFCEQTHPTQHPNTIRRIWLLRLFSLAAVTQKANHCHTCFSCHFASQQLRKNNFC